jgi:hypothetical protein
LKSSVQTLLLLLFFTNVSSQSYKLQGTIRDADTNETLTYASILVEENGEGLSSDKDGQLLMTLPQGNYTLRVSYLGYKAKKI